MNALCPGFVYDPELVDLNDFKPKSKTEKKVMQPVRVNEITNVDSTARKIEAIMKTVDKQKSMINDLNLDNIAIEVNVTISVKNSHYNGSLLINPKPETVKTLLNDSIAEANATIHELTSEIESTKLTVTIK